MLSRLSPHRLRRLLAGAALRPALGALPSAARKQDRAVLPSQLRDRRGRYLRAPPPLARVLLRLLRLRQP